MRPFKSQNDAIKEKIKLAKSGDRDAQCLLGNCYLEGNEDVDRNYAEALKWFSRAAEQNDAEAQYYMGKMYYGGLGVPKDWAEAYKWFDIAEYNRYIYTRDEYGTYTAMAMNMEKAHYVDLAAQAKHKLESEIPKDQLEVARRDIGQWYAMKAENGDPDAQVWLAKQYHDGGYFPQDFVKAYQWYKIAQNSYYFIKNHGCNETLAENAAANIAGVEAAINELETRHIDLAQLKQMSVLLANWYKKANRRGIPAAERAMEGWDNAEKGCAL